MTFPGVLMVRLSRNYKHCHTLRSSAIAKSVFPFDVMSGPRIGLAIFYDEALVPQH